VNHWYNFIYFLLIILKKHHIQCLDSLLLYYLLYLKLELLINLIHILHLLIFMEIEINSSVFIIY